MSNPSKALMLDVRTFVADNNIRRNTSSFSVNYGSTSENVSQSLVVLAPSESKVFQPPMNPTVVTVLRTTSPVTAQITPRNGSTFTVTVSKLLILDADISMMILINSSSTQPAKVSVTQA